MISSHRLPMWIAWGILAYTVCGNAIAQPAPDPAALSSVKIIENADFRRVIAVGRDCIKDKEWKLGVQALQAVLNEKNDHFLKLAEPDPANPKKEITRWVSARIQANDLIGSMPPEGLQAYEAAYGAEAGKLLDTAKKKKDRELMAEVAQRFRHTKAGAEAQKISMERFRESVAAAEARAKGWPSWRGNASNTGQASAAAPNLDTRLWSRRLFMDKAEGFNDEDQDQLAQQAVAKAIQNAEQIGLPVLPGSFPIASAGTVIYRSPRDIRAVALRDLEIKDFGGGPPFNVKRGQILWKSLQLERSLAVLLETTKTRPKTENWIAAYSQVPGYSSYLYDNTLLGTLSTDGRLLYAINDMAVSPLPNIFQPGGWAQPQLNPHELKMLMMSNELLAFDLNSGKRIWDITDAVPDFKDSHFLGVPISVGDKLYVLNEKSFFDPVAKDFAESELRLICIDPADVDAVGRPCVVQIQPLARIAKNNRFVEDISRRISAAAPGYADGVLVCPTNAGTVFGIDAMTRCLLWSYPYRDKAHEPLALPNPLMPAPPPKVAGPIRISKWQSAPPAIQDGKIVFTAPDADSVHCVNLRDGKPLWKKGQEKGDLYVAGVFEGRVLIVGEKSIRALDLKNGAQLWSIDTGALPTGQGTASKMIYYLPVKKGIVAIDLVKGEIKSRIEAGQKEVSPGNLVFYENMLLSQTPTEIVAYPLAPK